MKICIVHEAYPNEIRGSEIYISILTKLLIDRGHEVMLICNEVELLKECAYPGTVVEHAPFGGESVAARTFRTMLAAPRLLRLIKRAKPDLILPLDDLPSVPSAFIGKLLKIPVMYYKSYNEFNAWEETKTSKTPVFMFRLAELLTTKYLPFKRILSPNFYLVHEAEKMGVPKERFATVKICVDEDLFEQIKSDFDKQKERGRWGLSSEDFVITFIGALTIGKGITYLLEAIPLVVKELPQSKFIIVGDGELRESLNSLVRKLKIEEQTVFVGSQPYQNIPRIILMSDLMVIPSLMEGFSRAALESLALGRAMVTTNRGGLPEVNLSGETGLMVEAKDHVQLANSLIKLAKNDRLREGMEKKCVEVYRANFSADKYIREFLNVCKELIKA